MGEAAWSPDLTALADRYEVLGELRGTDNLRSYLARRRADRADVTILVARAPRDGGNNALTHFAADTQLLSNIAHPGMPRVLEGRWLGADSVAVVSERVRGSTLSALTTGEPLSFPRVAAVLQQVNGVMEWARAHGIVHRGVSLESIVVEDGSGRVLVSLVPTDIPLEGVPDACADARILGGLAFELLTGEPYHGGDPLEEMRELRPQLAQRVRDEVTAMLQCESGRSAPDVHTFIAMIATADEMRIGEEERARLEAELVQKHRLECERWEKQRQELEDRIAADERRLKEQQAALETSEAQHRDRLAAELAALEAQRADADERTRVAEEHATRAEARTRELEARARELEARARDLETRGRQLDSREADLEQKYAAVMPTIEKPAVRVPFMKEKTPPRGVVSREKQVPVAEPEVEAPAIVPVPFEETGGSDVEERQQHRSWTLPVSGAALVLLIVLGIALAHRRTPAAAAGAIRIGNSTIVPTVPALPGTTPGVRATVADSSAGSIVPVGPAVDSTTGMAATDGTTTLDSAQRAQTAASNTSVAPAAPAPHPAATAAAHRPAARQTTAPSTPTVYGPPAPTGPPTDSMVLVPIPVTPPVVHPTDTAHPRNDSVSRDTTPRRDTTASDTTRAFPAVDSLGH